MSRIKPIWRIVLGFLFLTVVVYNSSMLAFGGSFAGFAVMTALFVVYVVYAIKTPYDDPLRSMRDLMAQQAAEAEARARAEADAQREKLAAIHAEASARESARLAEREAAAARKAEWDRTHGLIVTALAGVTFDNDDGSSRQAILKDYYARGGEADLDLEEYDYKGSPAIRVLLDGEQVGHIPRRRVAEVSAVLDRIDRARLNVETFRPEEEEDEDGNVRRRGELIYRADLILDYKKDPEAGP